MLSRDEKIRFLKEVHTFQYLKGNQLEKLADFSVEERYPAGARIFSQGDPGEALFVVVEGRVGVEREVTDQDREKTDTVSLMVVREHEYFGEMSLFHDAPRSATATALRDTTILKVNQSDFGEIIEGYPQMLIELNSLLCQRLIEAYDKISELKLSRKPRELRNLYDKLDF
ncbi:MAG: cyclic nucleotide-binding domain-containing protein [Anaerolineales bacterium]|nr:cyclic nucleotide-binding domain-containing protein [Anaerolineales bacterium]